MTVSAPATYPQPFSCNGVLTTFDFTFGVSATSEVAVIHKTSLGVETTLTEGVDYTISATNDDYSSGGRITTTETYATGVTLVAKMIITLTQAAGFTEGMATLYETFETTLDKLTRIVQQLDERTDRCLSFTEASEETGDEIVPGPSALEYLRWNVGATALENAELVALGDLSAHESDKNAHNSLPGAATVASGVLTVTDAYAWYQVDGEGGVDDTLVSISGLGAGDVVELTPVDDTTTIIIAHSATMLLAGGLDCTMNNQYDNIVVRCISAGVCREISRMNAGG